VGVLQFGGGTRRKEGRRNGQPACVGSHVKREEKKKKKRRKDPKRKFVCNGDAALETWNSVTFNRGGGENRGDTTAYLLKGLHRGRGGGGKERSR